MTPILGVPVVGAPVAQSWARRHQATDEFVSLAPLYWRIAPISGVAPEVGYAQSAHETGFGRFGGVLDASYRNPCGLKKASGGGNYDPEAHQRFRSWGEGIMAHLDHLALYAGAGGYPRSASPDPRHFPQLAGAAATVEELGGKWAPSPGYGVRVSRYVKELRMTKPKVVVQAGHVSPREPGFESGTGTTREQELASAVQKRLANLLMKDGRYEVVLCGGRTPDPRPYKCDLFLSLHGDGSSSASSSGFCYGYPAGPSETFARMLQAAYERIPGHPPKRKDNYTRNLSGYYGFSTRRINSPVKVLVEHGFLTNPGERAWLFANVAATAEAHYRAVSKHFGRRPVAMAKPKPKKPVPRVDVIVANKTVNRGIRADNPRLWQRIRRFALKAKRIVIRRSQ